MQDEDDDVPEITPEYIEELKSQESRYQVLADAIQVEADLRDNVTIKGLMAAAKRNFDLAIDELIEISPLKSAEIARCLVNLKTLVLLKRTLESILTRGKQVEMQIRAMDTARSANE